MNLRPPSATAFRSPSSALRALTILCLSALHASPTLTVNTQPSGAAAPLTLPSDPTAAPPPLGLPYAILRLAPGHEHEQILSVRKVTESGKVLLVFPKESPLPFPPSPHLPVMGYRWQAGDLQSLHRSPDEQAPFDYRDAYYPDADYYLPYSLLYDMNDSGVVIGSYSHEDPDHGDRIVAGDEAYYETGCFWPADQTEPQALPSPSSSSAYGYAPYHITDTGIIYGRMSERAQPLQMFHVNYVPAFEYGLTWSSITAIPAPAGTAWPVGDAAVPQIARVVTSTSPQGQHTLGLEIHHFISGEGEWNWYYDFERYFELPLRDGLLLDIPATPTAINDHGRWIAVEPVPTDKGDRDFICWSDDQENLVPLEFGSASAINNVHDILGRDGSVQRVVWHWVHDPDGGEDDYHYLKYTVTPSLPVGWTVDSISGGFTTSGLFGGGIRRTLDDQGQPIPVNQQPLAPVLFIPAELAVDANRDGVITLAKDTVTPSDSDITSEAKPFRFWSNDDDDAGDMGGTDIPGQVSGSANYADGHVNGTRDLVDFFPVYLDIKKLLNVLPASSAYATYPVTYKYKLKQSGAALNFVYTDKGESDAMLYQKQVLTDGFGPEFRQAPGVATTQQITADGVELNTAFLDGIRYNGGGVILIEARVPTTAPLVLSVEKADGTVLTEIKLPIKISSVEDMFRHVDLTSVAKNYDGSDPSLPAAPTTFPLAADEPANYPDSLTNGKYFVFLHGYKVDAQNARGWHAEVFKRLYVLGSKARFVGITWHGATGLDYHKAVYNAFETGDALAAALGFTDNADVTVAAHSLGNMVVSHAIESGGFTPSRYYMINAAVPIEAYELANVDATQRTAMIEDDWKNRDSRLYAANWHELFASTPSDHRNELSWKNRFARVIQQFTTYNFYSTGEDVVENPVSSSSNVTWDMLTNWSTSRGAWGHQEFVKGTNVFSSGGASWAFERTQAGWNWNYLAYLSAPDANSSTVREQLKTRPAFERFLEGDLMNADPTVASTKAGEAKVQYDLLGRALPALSYAAAANRSIALDQLQSLRNFDMESEGRTQNQWPTEGHTNDSKSVGRWLHSDFKNVALPYVYPMYEAMISKGALDK